VAIPQEKLSGFQKNSSRKSQISTFIDLEVEQRLLDFYLKPENEDSICFYNEKTIGKFVKGNSFGGSPQSGIPDRPLKYENYAWESLSAAANSLGKDRKSIRNRRDNGTLTEISREDFINFQGTKIKTANSKTYFANKAEELKVLKQKLGFRS
jgi:hypothetical protein